ncbi:hypothetical protein [Sulfurimonas autotrophica]|uniref:Uncharacterized protein n=1 Tax=Sulfurimonas autotrophica (strain ATCC BAA-671 / DSM 16294 / JCM 11897 / OK10) TaxID=563040 RepID=E0URV3_SULAO|nr:hypothetical protein [Sulfurimonas autotrophica]ADN10117.1 hypothetical protein Saut_2075 [Sulfurimonas autotrophica DSM 16294]
MNITQYTFRSPYPSPVQVGHLDPNSVKDDSSSSKGDTSSLLKSTNQTLTEAKTVESSLKSEVKPVVSSGESLDVYA